MPRQHNAGGEGQPTASPRSSSSRRRLLRVLISNALREALSGQEVALHDRGRHELKGVPGEWQLFAVETAGCID